MTNIDINKHRHHQNKWPISNKPDTLKNIKRMSNYTLCSFSYDLK